MYIDKKRNMCLRTNIYKSKPVIKKAVIEEVKEEAPRKPKKAKNNEETKILEENGNQ